MTVKRSHELKHLKSHHAELLAKYNAANESVKAGQKEAALFKRQADEVEARIKAAESHGNEPVVSEHALLRYFERVLGFDLEAIRSQLVTDDIAAVINQTGSGKIPAKGCRLVFKDRVVVTLEVA